MPYVTWCSVESEQNHDDGEVLLELGQTLLAMCWGRGIPPFRFESMHVSLHRDESRTSAALCQSQVYTGPGITQTSQVDRLLPSDPSRPIVRFWRAR